MPVRTEPPALLLYYDVGAEGMTPGILSISCCEMYGATPKSPDLRVQELSDPLIHPGAEHLRLLPRKLHACGNNGRNYKAIKNLAVPAPMFLRRCTSRKTGFMNGESPAPRVCRFRQTSSFTASTPSPVIVTAAFVPAGLRTTARARP